MIGEHDVVPLDLATTFAALGDARRLGIIVRLQKQNSLSISSLCEGTDVSRQAISKHLKTLAKAQLVSSEKAGRETLYRLESQRMNEANAFLDQVAMKWDSALDRLKSHVE
ncbi:MAG: ArsR/SmtB family transcription factor [Inquilinaceae bacterium]